MQDWIWVVRQLQAHLMRAEADGRPRLGSEGSGFKAGYLYKKGAKRRNWKRRLSGVKGG